MGIAVVIIEKFDSCLGPADLGTSGQDSVFFLSSLMSRFVDPEVSFVPFILIEFVDSDLDIT